MILRFVLITFVSLLLLERPAEAYVDPGAGGMLTQLLIGGVIAGLVLLRSGWQRVKGRFQRGSSSRRDALK